MISRLTGSGRRMLYGCENIVCFFACVFSTLGREIMGCHYDWHRRGKRRDGAAIQGGFDNDMSQREGGRNENSRKWERHEKCPDYID